MHDSADIIHTSPTSSPPIAGSQPELETAHILFMDIVGYSKLPMKDKCDVQDDLRRAVQATEEYRETREGEAMPGERLICRPSGDGMSLLFFGAALAPVRCAVQITDILRDHTHIRLRMGIHSGPIRRVPDINAHSDVAGDGIVVAQRVMDLGDAGHILLSGESKDALENIQDYRYPMGHLFLVELGNCVVKHGHSIRVFSLRDRHYGEPKFGNPIVPNKLRSQGPILVFEPPPPPLLVSLISSLKIAAAGVLLIALLCGACQLAALAPYEKVTTIPVREKQQALQSWAAPPASGSSGQQGQEPALVPGQAFNQARVPNLMRMRFSRAQALAAKYHLVLQAHDESGPIAALPTDLTYDHQYPPAGVLMAPNDIVYIRVRRIPLSAHIRAAADPRPATSWPITADDPSSSGREGQEASHNPEASMPDGDARADPQMAANNPSPSDPSTTTPEVLQNVAGSAPPAVIPDTSKDSNAGKGTKIVPPGEPTPPPQDGG